MVLQPLLDRLQSQKSGMLSEVRDWPAASLHYQPSSEGWSAIQVLDHLVRTEVEILAAARTGRSAPHRIGVTDRLRTRFLQSVFRSDRKVKVPSTATQMLPGPRLELRDVAQRWDESREALAVFVKAIPQGELNQGIFRHPVAGWMGTPEILEFFSVHIVHHRHQLTRLQKASREEGPARAG